MSTQVVLAGEPYLNFINSLKSKETKKEYRKILVTFLSHHDNITLDGLLSLPHKDIEHLITNYVTNILKNILYRKRFEDLN